jgi:hypothetical protein
MRQNSDNNIIFHTIYTETTPIRVHTHMRYGNLHSQTTK